MKLEEIEERIKHPIYLKEPGKHLQIEQARDDIKYLLSKVKELEAEVNIWYDQFCKVRENAMEKDKRIKELKEGIEKLKYSDLCGKEDYFIDAKIELYKLLE